MAVAVKQSEWFCQVNEVLFLIRIINKNVALTPDSFDVIDSKKIPRGSASSSHLRNLINKYHC